MPQVIPHSVRTFLDVIRVLQLELLILPAEQSITVGGRLPRSIATGSTKCHDEEWSRYYYTKHATTSSISSICHIALLVSA